MSEQTYNTNLAAEFFVLSSLHRLGLSATLTLGNKKSVDVVVVRGEGEAVTIDVKGLAGTSSWPGHFTRTPRENHFYVFVCYLSKIGEPEASPEVYVVPSRDIAEFVYTHLPTGREFVPLKRLRSDGAKYRHAWRLISASRSSKSRRNTG